MVFDEPEYMTEGGYSPPKEDVHTKQVTGQYPVAIATSLALEGLAGIYPDRPASKPPILGYTDLVINVRTLIRNILEATGGVILPSDMVQMKEQLYNELTMIPNIVAQMSSNSVEVHFFMPSYKDVERLYPHANFVDQQSTDRKKLILKQTNDLIKFVNSVAGNFPIHFNASAPYLPTGKTLLLTHLPIDILHLKGYQSLSLIESHTGLLKPSKLFHTKLKDGKKYPNLPFDKMTIQMFGDSGSMFLPRPKNFRDKILEYANNKRWNTTWTKAMVLNSLNDNKEPLLLAEVKKLYG